MAKKSKREPRVELGGQAQSFGQRPFEGLEALRASLPGADRAPVDRPSQQAPTRRAGEEERGPQVGGAIVRFERKGRGGKTVTCIEGLGLEPADLLDVARGLKRALGCGATVERHAIVLQGDQRARAVEALERLGQRGARLGN